MGDGKDPAKVLDIKTADLKRAAPDLQTAAVDLGKALTTLVESLDGLGEPWENDMVDGHVDNDELIAGMFTEVKVTKADGAGER
ncbi:hypothetical protein JHN63_07545 [Streptomyces sp. MBT65]|uniref:hypothetical protein n=1 Tax=Streptomyces sp. MBT65 TaxID=1488395 RepID=UPI00190DA03D|nr:hypothetical protein [Streptomyces sp. MBT65]MBK3573671.1 hypothetical protein [Streptomyces sp. MBT65]